MATLQKVDIRMVKDLTEVDLRTFPEMDGVTRENLKVLKQRARAVCRREGITYETASYSTGKVDKTAPVPANGSIPRQGRARNVHAPLTDLVKAGGFMVPCEGDHFVRAWTVQLL